MTHCLRPRHAVRSVAAAAVLATTLLAAPAMAQDRLAPAADSSRATLTDGTQPVVVVTLGSVKKLMDDVSYLAEITSQPQLAMFPMLAATFTQGMDMDQPIGMLVPLVGGTPQPIVVLPTKDIRPILKRLEAQTGPVDELDDGTLVLTVNQNMLYIKQNANNAVAAQNQAALALAPEDAGDLFQGMGNNYNVAIRLQVQQVPVEIRNILIDQLRQGFEQTMAQQPDAASGREVAENSIAQLERLVQEADELNVGLNIDKANKQVALDFSFTAVGGTQLAAVYGGQQSIPSRFASVIRDDAAAYIHSATSISPEAITQAKEGIASSLSMIKGALENEGNLTEDQVNEIDQYIDRLSDIVTESLSEGKADMGALVMAGRDEFKAVIGTFVADGNKVAELAKDLATKVPDSPDAPKFKFDNGNFGGVTLHLIEADVPASEDEVRKLFGDKIQVHIGTAPKAVYVAAGRGSEELLKEFITSGSSDNGGDRPLGQFKMKLLPFMELAQSVEANDNVAAMINALTNSEDKGEVNVTTKSIPNGSAMKLTIGEGLIRSIGAAAMAGRQAQQPF
ncbi:hypothetical protein [Stieleria mannarensis]|uniref:hypothetical protein n=1 Tax=Stieleria mannarensis TaxID=2755585 RepID=UPI0015FEE997|nr:hypothetical protein [Rhodopirellula sp. JC639]